MENKKADYRAMINLIRVLHGSLGFMLAIFAAVVLWLNLTNPAGTLSSENQIFLYIPIVLLLFALLTASIVYKGQLRQGRKPDMTLSGKMAVFQTAHLIRMAFFESVGLFAIVACFITGNNYNLGVLLIVLVIFIFLTPTPYKIMIELDLSQEEKDLLENNQD